MSDETCLGIYLTKTKACICEFCLNECNKAMELFKPYITDNAKYLDNTKRKSSQQSNKKFFQSVINTSRKFCSDILCRILCQNDDETAKENRDTNFNMEWYTYIYREANAVLYKLHRYYALLETTVENVVHARGYIQETESHLEVLYDKIIEHKRAITDTMLKDAGYGTSIMTPKSNIYIPTYILYCNYITDRGSEKYPSYYDHNNISLSVQRFEQDFHKFVKKLTTDHDIKALFQVEDIILNSTHEQISQLKDLYLDHLTVHHGDDKSKKHKQKIHNQLYNHMPKVLAVLTISYL
jgi:hypothetical protein